MRRRTSLLLPGLGARARAIAGRIEALTDRWIDGPAPTVAELDELAQDLDALLRRIVVARAVAEASAAAQPAGASPPSLSA